MTLAQTLNGRLRKVPAWPLYLLGLLPLAWLIWLIVTGDLGVDPVKTLEHKVGKIGLQFLVAGLCVTPLRRFTGVSLIKYRRAIGLLAFFYIALHLLVWLGLDIQFRWTEIGTDILKRPYITIGMAGFAAMVPLAITSNNLSVRQAGGGGVAEAAPADLSRRRRRGDPLHDAGQGLAAAADPLSGGRRGAAGAARGVVLAPDGGAHGLSRGDSPPGAAAVPAPGQFHCVDPRVTCC